MAYLDNKKLAADQLHPGPNGMPHGQVMEIQRSRMLAAAVEAVEEVGYSGMTVAQVIGRAKVSRKTFYHVFADREDCFLAAFEEAVNEAGALLGEACAGEAGWRESTRAGLFALLSFLDEEPALAKLCVVEALAAGTTVLERRARALEGLTEVVDRGRSVMKPTRELAEVTAEGVVGAVFAVLHGRLLDEGNTEPLVDLLGPLMSIVVLPYLGARAASGELSRPALEARRRGQRSPTRAPSKDPLEGLDMRLTHRTVRVLTSIAERPGSSNRVIAQGAGIADPGQISKILSRLERLRLLENSGKGQAGGTSNAWRLSERGAQVERATRPH
jgi:AcrR family transcriptional regulator